MEWELKEKFIYKLAKWIWLWGNWKHGQAPENNMSVKYYSGSEETNRVPSVAASVQKEQFLEP